MPGSELRMNDLVKGTNACPPADFFALGGKLEGHELLTLLA